MPLMAFDAARHAMPAPAYADASAASLPFSPFAIALPCYLPLRHSRFLATPLFRHTPCRRRVAAAMLMSRFFACRRRHVAAAG